MNMTSKRMYTSLLCLIGLLVAALPVGAYKIDGLLSSHAQVRLKAKSQALEQEQQSFEVAQRNIKKYAGLEEIAKAIVPQDKSQAEAIREIVNVAAKNGVGLGSITFPPSTLGGTGSASPGASSSSSGVQPAPSASGAAVNVNSSQNRLSQLSSVSGIPGVYQLPITITSDDKHPILYGQLISFLGDLEHNRRTAQVNSISINPDENNAAYLSFTITLNEYIKP